MNAPGNGRPTRGGVRLRVELGSQLAPFAHRVGDASLAHVIEADVEGLLRTLGIDADAHVTIAAAESARPLRVTVNGVPLSYPPILARRAWVAVAPLELQWHAGSDLDTDDAGYPPLWTNEFAHELAEGGSSHWPLVAALIRRLAYAIVLEHPGSLVGDSQVAEYGRLHALAPRTLAPILRSLLDLGVSARRGAVIAEVIRESEKINRPRDDTIEAAHARVRSHDVELRAHPETIGAVLSTPPPTAARFSVYSESVREDLRKLFEALEEAFFAQFGFQLPKLTWVPSESMPKGMLSVKLDEWVGLPVPLVLPGQRIVDALPEDLPASVPAAGTAVHPVTGVRRAIVDDVMRDTLEAAGYVTRGPIDWVVVTVFADVASHVARLIGIEDVEYQLARLRYHLIRFGSAGEYPIDGPRPALVDAVLSRYTLGELTRILRAVVSEGLSVQNLPRILERLLEYDPIPFDPDVILLDDRQPLVPGCQESWETVYASLRHGLQSHISHRFTWDNAAGIHSVGVYLLEPELETRLAHGIRHAHGIPAQPLPEPQAEVFRDAVWREVGGAGVSPGRVVLTNEGVRGSVRRLLEQELPDLPVLSYAELRPDVNVQALARIETGLATGQESVPAG